MYIRILINIIIPLLQFIFYTILLLLKVLDKGLNIKFNYANLVLGFITMIFYN